jgi:hypothetical protein
MADQEVGFLNGEPHGSPVGPLLLGARAGGRLALRRERGPASAREGLLTLEPIRAVGCVARAAVLSHPRPRQSASA